MPNLQDPTARAVRHGRACPFSWCQERHIDDWINDEDGDAWRAHIADLPEAARAGFGRMAPYLVVHEKRTAHGVLFSAAGVMHDEYESPIPVDEFAARLATLIAHLPQWRDAARDAAEVRTAGAAA